MMKNQKLNRKYLAVLRPPTGISRKQKVNDTHQRKDRKPVLLKMN